MQNIPPHGTVLAASSAPIGKVNNPAIVSMGGAVLVWAAKTYLKTEIPAEVAVAMLGLLSYFVGYFTPIKRRELSP